jgi:hypothetical protein
MPSFAGGWNVGVILFTYGPYDDVILSDAPKAFWPLDDKDPIAYQDYDAMVLDDTPKAYWPLDSIDAV